MVKLYVVITHFVAAPTSQPIRNHMPFNNTEIKGGLNMKTRILNSIVITLLIGLLFISGCATFGKVKEPSEQQGTMLIGRIKVVYYDYPKGWKINGEHTRNIVVYFVDPNSEEIIKAKSKGQYGVFYVINSDVKRLVIAGFEYERKAGNMKYANSHGIENTYIDITKNCVNNLGDIIWHDTFTGEEKLSASRSTFTKTSSHEIMYNYDEVESWFRNAYTESSWNRLNWVDVEYTVR